MDVFELFTDAAEAVVLRGHDEALGVNAEEIEPVHLLLSIMDADDGIAARVLQSEGLSRQSVIRELGLVETPAPASGRGTLRSRLKGNAMQFSGAAQQALTAAEQRAQELQSPAITAEHLLLGLLEADEMRELLGALGAGADSITRTIIEKLKSAD